MKRRETVTGITITLIAGILWGFSGTCGQYLFMNYHMDPNWLTSVRMICSGIILCIAGLRLEKESMKGIWKSKQDRMILVLFAIFGLLFCQLTYMKAIAYSNSGTATILQYLGPVLIMIISCLMAKKLPAKKEVFAIMLALIGTFILATHGNIYSMVLSTKGLVWGLLSAVGLTCYSMIPQGIVTRWGSITITGYGLLIGGGILGIYEQIWLEDLTLDIKAVVAMIAIIVLGTALAFSMYLYGIKIVGAVKASMLASIEPLAATVFMVVWLHSSFIWIDVVGFACIITTVFILAKKDSKDEDSKEGNLEE